MRDDGQHSVTRCAKMEALVLLGVNMKGRSKKGEKKATKAPASLQIGQA